MAVYRHHTIRFLAMLIGAGMLIGAHPAWAQSPDQPGDFQRLIAEKAPALVTIKFILKINMGRMFRGRGDQESETEITGVMIDPKGLILCSNTQLSGFTTLMQHFMGEAGANISSKPTDMKVLIGDETDWLEAEFLARDSELDLAWVQIKNPDDRKFAYIDLTQSAKPDIGERLFTVNRMGKHFDRCVVVSESRVGGLARKPRELYIASSDISSSMGLPIYTAENKVVGVSILQLPDAEDSMGNPMFNRMSGFQSMGSMILPADKVVKATSRAKETAKTAETKPQQATTSAVAEDEDAKEKETADEN